MSKASEETLTDANVCNNEHTYTVNFSDVPELVFLGGSQLKLSN